MVSYVHAVSCSSTFLIKKMWCLVGGEVKPENLVSNKMMSQITNKIKKMF